MKIALNSYSGYGAHFGLRLLAEGHSVDYFLSMEKYSPILEGLLKPKIVSLDHRMSHTNYTGGLPDYSKYDVSVFDLTGRKRQSDYSVMNCPTIGDGSLHCALEDDREMGLKLMEDAGIKVPPYEVFEDIDEAKAYIKKTGRRYVFKPYGGQDQDAATTYVSKDAEDMLTYIDKVESSSHDAKFILQEYIKGIEISVEGWFNGSDFYCLNSTLEEKKFMNDNIGPNTGCSGNMVFIINHETRIYKEGLAKTKDLLAQSGFHGMIDLNTIVTEDDCYGLEWTPRFGYDASHTLFNMYAGGLGNLLGACASGATPENSWKAEFGVSTRVTVPPYPTEIRMQKEAGIPIKGIKVEDEEQMLKTYMYDVRMNGHGLESAGVNGFLLAPVETGDDPATAWDKLETTLKNIQIPDMQYRTDLKKKTCTRYIELQRMGWI